MKISTILERILTGKKVKFVEATISSGSKTGNKVVVLIDVDSEKNLKFIIGASVDNFIRFRKWIGKEAYADYQINKFSAYHTQFGKLPTIKLSTEVEVEKESYKNRHRDEGDEYDL